MLRQSQYKGFLPYRPDPDNELGNWMVSLQAVNLNNYPPPPSPENSDLESYFSGFLYKK